jgi:hypothetical protein
LRRVTLRESSKQELQRYAVMRRVAGDCIAPERAERNDPGAVVLSEEILSDLAGRQLGYG